MAHRKAADAARKPHCQYTVSQRYFIFINSKIHSESIPEAYHIYQADILIHDFQGTVPWSKSAVRLFSWTPNFPLPPEYLRERMFSGFGKK